MNLSPESSVLPPADGFLASSKPDSARSALRFLPDHSSEPEDRLCSALFETGPRQTREQASTILSIGDDLLLLATRHKVLESAGYVVCSLPGKRGMEAEHIVKVDLTIICHTVDHARSAHIIEALREVYSSPPVLRLAFSCSSPRQSSHCVVVTPDGPRSLLEKFKACC